MHEKNLLVEDVVGKDDLIVVCAAGGFIGGAHRRSAYRALRRWKGRIRSAIEGLVKWESIVAKFAGRSRVQQQSRLLACSNEPSDIEGNAL